MYRKWSRQRLLEYLSLHQEEEIDAISLNEYCKIASSKENSYKEDFASLKVGESVSYQKRHWGNVRTSAARYGKEWQCKFITKIDRRNDTIVVRRTR